MAAVGKISATTERIWDGLMSKIRGTRPLKRGEHVIKTWQFNRNSFPCSGQIYAQKTMRNGNIKTRVTTAFYNGAFAVETTIKNPSGELLSAYAGIRSSRGTWVYNEGKNIKEIKKIADKIFEMSDSTPNAFRLIK